MGPELFLCEILEAFRVERGNTRVSVVHRRDLRDVLSWRSCSSKSRTCASYTEEWDFPHRLRLPVQWPLSGGSCWGFSGQEHSTPGSSVVFSRSLQALSRPLQWTPLAEVGLFQRLTGSQDPGMPRPPQYGKARVATSHFIGHLTAVSQ
jgi:hypothetical protein